MRPTELAHSPSNNQAGSASLFSHTACLYPPFRPLVKALEVIHTQYICQQLLCVLATVWVRARKYTVNCLALFQMKHRESPRIKWLAGHSDKCAFTGCRRSNKSALIIVGRRLPSCLPFPGQSIAICHSQAKEILARARLLAVRKFP